ncbi:peptidylprolyl isomerase [Jannaschia pohangensis]|uniref:Peptidyl-prolyl cis-trans isomerase D n=1 Tax=Jannaschia pohangensis TaxID=390807 RepID=A0A1I3HY64_9RHOB|nr:peptidylprolyl isomerase [Jannaschia pohangensis]SFI40696.1 peptidyl-prolyl cis-trans isomerase D [Jannaschia pohangensis]
MAEQRRKKKTNVVVWAVLGLLILALGGFGIGGFGGTLSSVARVGDREITVQDYFNALQSEQNRLRQQTGQAFTVQQLQLFGIDQQVMERLLASAALEHEAERVGVSVGDVMVAERIRNNPAFSGVAGGFDREGYAFVLDQSNLTEARYEARIRDEIAREVLQAAVLGGTEVPDAYVDALAAWISETRDITVTTITVSDLDGGATAPTEDDLQAFYDANPALFETPELRAVTYAWVSPTRLMDEVEVDEDALRALYDDRIDDYRQPARVLAERLAFADEDAANAALAAINSGERTFESYVEERGLTLEDVDQGDLSAADLGTEAAAAVFALQEPGMAGPVPSGLGPTLYRVNAILDPTEVTFEEAREELEDEFAGQAARRRIDDARENIDDLLASGATLEEVAGETDLEVGSLQWDASAEDGVVGFGILGYDTFREAARQAEVGDFPELESLEDGGLFALRLDEIIAPSVPPLDSIRADVEAAWQADTRTRRLIDRAEAQAADPTRDTAAEGVDLSDVARDARLDGIPSTVIARAFEIAAGETVAIEGDDQNAYVLTVTAVNAADLTTGDAAEIRQAIEQQTRSEIATDLFEGYGRAVQARAGFTVDAQAVEAVNAQLTGGVARGNGG